MTDSKQDPEYVLTAPDLSISVTSAEGAHAMYLFDCEWNADWRAKPRITQIGIMSACLAVAMGHSFEKNIELLKNPFFVALSTEALDSFIEQDKKHEQLG